MWLSIKAIQLITIDNWHIYVFFYRETLMEV